ncbi:MAG: hypothetical protein CL878_06275 [Dehalococcoidia bacterium]|nr:hypothetical protein [Dehalococcoidia bacterium]
MGATSGGCTPDSTLAHLRAARQHARSAGTYRQAAAEHFAAALDGLARLRKPTVPATAPAVIPVKPAIVWPLFVTAEVSRLLARAQRERKPAAGPPGSLRSHVPAVGPADSVLHIPLLLTGVRST